MASRLLFPFLLVGLLTWLLPNGYGDGRVALVSPSLALEKIKLGTPIKMAAPYYLPVLTAEQRGFWKDNGLEAEWMPFTGSVVQMRAVATRAVNIGIAKTFDTPLAAERGLPVFMVAELVSSQGFHIWVKADSPYHNVRDLKGTRMGVTTLGGPMHAYGRIIAKAHGMEKDIRFVGAGGGVESVAGFRAGAYGSILTGTSLMAKMTVQGMARAIASVGDYLPKPMLEDAVFARKDFARGNPDLVRSVIRATLQATDFMRKNPRWAIDVMKSFQGLSEEEAKLVYEDLRFTSTGKIDRKAVENVRRLYIEYGILTEKAPAVDELFSNEYLPS